MSVRKQNGAGNGTKSSAPGKNSGWKIGPVLIAVFAFLAMVATVLVNPAVSFEHHRVTVTAGVTFMALLSGALFWGVIEVFTPAGKGIVDTIWRPALGFGSGLLVGGFIGYYYGVGELLMIPAFNGNPGALFDVAMAFILFTVFIFDAAWAHSRNFLGGNGRNKGTKKTQKPGKLKAAALAPFLPMATASGGISGSAIFNSIWNLFMKYLFKPVLVAFSNSFGGLMGSFTGGLMIMFNSWGSSLAVYGVWGPIMVSVSLGAAGMVAYVFFIMIRGEEDVDEVETEIG